MKKNKHTLTFFFLLSALSIFAQVSVDHQIVLTGAGAEGKLTGIQQVSANQDAVSANYVQRDSLKFAIATGSNNAYAVSLNPAITGSYTVGMVVLFKANFANTGGATLNVNGLGADTIRKNYNADLAANDIQSGQLVSVMFDGANFQMLSQLGNSSTVVPHGKQQFTSSGTFNVPTGVTTVWVTMCGGGGGGGGNSYNSSASDEEGGAGGGGGASIYIAYPLTLTQSSYTITIGDTGSRGNGGTSGSPNGTSGGAGGNTVFGSGVNILLTANGGGAGISVAASTSSTAGGGGGANGSVANGTYIYGYGAAGSAGATGGSTGTSYSNGGGGGSSLYGSAGAGGTTGAGTSAIGFGAGGGGAANMYSKGCSCYGGAAFDGGTGAPGFMLIEW